MKLTWNQRRALERLVQNAFEGPPREIAESPRPSGPYLCGSAARAALVALVRKGLVELVGDSPFRYRITDAGRDALTSSKEADK